eukprot:scaffold187082_cov28-Attheya_sp.AAC.2
MVLPCHRMAWNWSGHGGWLDPGWRVGCCKKIVGVLQTLLLTLTLITLLGRDRPWEEVAISQSSKPKEQPSGAILLPTMIDDDQKKKKDAVVFLAPQRNKGTMWKIHRFCLLLRVVRSVDQHLNAKYGPYPIYILVAHDFELDPKHKDRAYSDTDRALIRKWAPT